MSRIFVQLLNLSIPASWLIVAILMVRIVFRKFPKGWMCYLWGLVCLRLLIPNMFQSSLSVVPSIDTVSIGPISSVSSITEIAIETNTIDKVFYTQKLALDIINIMWIIGMVVLIAYAIYSYSRIYYKVKDSRIYQENIYVSNQIDNAFILGVFRPKIYLPGHMSDDDLQYVISHERLHLKRKDYLWKPLGYVLLTVYWFNPLMWIAYSCLCKDIELACDEQVIKDMSIFNKKKYSSVILSCSVSRNHILACPVAFGEVGTKERVKSVLNYKKPTILVFSLCAFLTVVIALCFMANPITDDNKKMVKVDVNNILTGTTWPVENPKITCEWGCYLGHYGVDITNDKQDDGAVFAVQDGVVTDVGYHDEKGNYVVIMHPNAYYSVYENLGSIHVSKGTNVDVKDTIGQLGMSGLSTGPHVHFYFLNPEGKPVINSLEVLEK